MTLHRLPTVIAQAPRAAFAAILVLTSSIALSQSDADNSSKLTSGGTMGMGVVSAPAYQGADHRRAFGSPIFEYRWANGIFVGGDGLVGYQYSPNSMTQYGVLLGIDAGRKESDSKYLRGMGDIQTKVTVGGYAKATVAEVLLLSAALKVGSGNDQNGALLNLTAAYSVPISGPVQMSILVGATVANDRHMRSSFGVSSAQAVSSGYRAYSPGSGILDTSASVELTYPVTPNWILIGSLKNIALQSSAKNSPLTRKACDSSGAVGLIYAF